MLCECPAPTELPDIFLSTCLEDFGQIWKFWFRRIYSSGTTKNSHVISSADPAEVANWSTLLTASDGTKVTVGPLIDNPVSTPGEPRTFGGGNATRGGIEIIKGPGPSTLDVMFNRQQQRTIAHIKKMICEGDNLGVYLINEFGQIGGINNNVDSPTIFYPIPVATLFVGDKKFGGFDEIDGNAGRLQFYPNWSDNFHIVTPSDFNALDLANS